MEIPHKIYDCLIRRRMPYEVLGTRKETGSAADAFLRPLVSFGRRILWLGKTLPLRDDFCQISFLLIAPLFVFLPSAASAQQILYNNGAPNHTSANDIAYFIGAEDFTLTSSQTITAVRAWLYGNSGYAGSIAWTIYANSGNQPGALLASGNSPASFTATGFIWSDGTPEYQMDLPITPFTAAASTTYWLGIRNAVPNPQVFPSRIPPFAWEWTNPNGTLKSFWYGYGCCGAPSGWYQLNYSSTGDNRGAEHAFQLLALVPPRISSLAATPSTLWPPNHKMVSVALAVGASGVPAPFCQISSVTSNEPITVPGETDWVVTGPLTLNLRAERSGSGTGRVYTVTVTCTNGVNPDATKTVMVSVPHDQGK